MRNIKYILIIVAIFLGGLIINNYIEKNNENKLSDEIVYDYFSTQIKDINDLKNDKIIGNVYFARDTCPVCLEFNKYLDVEFKKNKDLVLFKFDTDYWRKDKEFRTILDKYSVTEVPMIIRINKDKSYDILKINNQEKIQMELNKFLYGKE